MRSLHLQKKTVDLTSTKWLKGDGGISAPLFFLFTQPWFIVVGVVLGTRKWKTSHQHTMLP